jgi:glycerol-3-phosphate acyltransferase PlsY
LEYGIIAGILVVSYLFGSVPFGLIIGKALYGTDIRQHGSGNIGATNAYRTLGPLPGLGVFAADFLKGFLPVMLTNTVLEPVEPELVPLVSILAGVIAMIGHNYSVFLKFKGGKGMSTAGGFIAAIWPQIVPILFIVWVIVIAVTRYVSLASIIIAVLFPILVIVLDPSRLRGEYVLFSAIAGAVIVYRHRMNIGRLIAGTELKIGMKPKKKGKKPEGDSAE